MARQELHTEAQRKAFYELSEHIRRLRMQISPYINIYKRIIR